MAVLSLGEIPALKKLVQLYGYELHVQDACGGQAFRLEPIKTETSEAVFGELEQFFASRRLKLQYFGADRLHFSLLR